MLFRSTIVLPSLPLRWEASAETLLSLWSTVFETAAIAISIIDRTAGIGA